MANLMTTWLIFSILWAAAFLYIMCSRKTRVPDAGKIFLLTANIYVYIVILIRMTGMVDEPIDFQRSSFYCGLAAQTTKVLRTRRRFFILWKIKGAKPPVGTKRSRTQYLSKLESTSTKAQPTLLFKTQMGAAALILYSWTKGAKQAHLYIMSILSPFARIARTNTKCPLFL